MSRNSGCHGASHHHFDQRAMTISIMSVQFDEDTMWVELSDGRTLGVPLASFPWLLQASPAQRERVELSRIGMHWDDLDEQISVPELLRGLADMAKRTHRAA